LNILPKNADDLTYTAGVNSLLIFGVAPQKTNSKELEHLLSKHQIL
jgi:hypothetical protein